MLWIPVALAGYFLNAVTALFDKYLLAGRIKAPAVYAFFVSLFSLFGLVFIPFGFQFLSWQTTGLFLLSGTFFLYGLVAFYAAMKHNEVSRIAPLVGTTLSVAALLFGYVLPDVLGEFTFTLERFFALTLLIGGGLLISFYLPIRRGGRLPKLVLIAGVSLAISIVLLKYGYRDANFVSGLVWSRLGMFGAGLSLLLYPVFRREILLECAHFSLRRRSSVGTGAIFVLNKTLAGIASFLLTYATFLGPVSFVQALSGMQYVFLLAMAIPLSVRYQNIFGERLYFWDWFQKGCAIIIIGLGLWIASSSGVTLFTL